MRMNAYKFSPLAQDPYAQTRAHLSTVLEVVFISATDLLELMKIMSATLASKEAFPLPKG